MVRGSGSIGIRKTLHEMIAQVGAEKVFGHTKFMPGRAPARLEVIKSSTFSPNDPNVADMLAHAKKCKAVELVWVLRFEKEAKPLMPYGIAVESRKQLLFTAEGSIVLA